jgi:hypothetical protein
MFEVQGKHEMLDAGYLMLVKYIVRGALKMKAVLRSMFKVSNK